jgi:hypothetical protein
MYPRLLSALVAAGLALSLADAQPAPAGAATTTNPNVTSTHNGTNSSRRTADKTTRVERDRSADESGVERVGFDRACGNHKHLYFDRSNRAHFICLGAQSQVGPDTTAYTATASQPPPTRSCCTPAPARPRSSSSTSTATPRPALRGTTPMLRALRSSPPPSTPMALRRPSPMPSVRSSRTSGAASRRTSRHGMWTLRLKTPASRSSAAPPPPTLPTASVV